MLFANGYGGFSPDGREYIVQVGERSTPERLFDLIARHRPTILVNVPTMMRQMVAEQDRERKSSR